MIMEVLREGKADKTRCVHMMRGKTKFFFENCLRFNPICAKHAIVATQSTCKQVAKMSRENPLNKIFKIFSKFFSRLEGPLEGKLRNLLCKLSTGASTRDQVTKMSCENDKNSEISKIFQSVFCNWETHLLESHKSWHDPRVSCQNKVVKQKFWIF